MDGRNRKAVHLPFGDIRKNDADDSDWSSGSDGDAGAPADDQPTAVERADQVPPARVGVVAEASGAAIEATVSEDDHAATADESKAVHKKTKNPTSTERTSKPTTGTSHLFGSSSDDEDDEESAVEEEEEARTVDRMDEDVAADEEEDDGDAGGSDTRFQAYGDRLGVPAQRRAKKVRRHIEENIELPHMPRLATGEKKIHLVKMPNFLHVESTPFDPETYEDQDALDEEEQGADGGAQNAKLKLENTLRWRQALTADGDAVPVKQSNARFVKWSDGSLSLVVGAETFEVCHQDLSGQHQYLFVRHTDFNNTMEAQTKFQEALMFRPFSTSSLTHKKLMATVHANSRATYKTKYVQGAADPEKLRLAAEKLEADKIRNRRRLKAQRSSHAGRLDANALEGGNDVDQRNVYLSGTDDSDLSDDPYASAVRRRAPASGNRRRAPRAGGAGSTADSSDGEDLDEYEKDDFVVDDDEEIEVGEEDEEEEEDDLDDFAMKRDDKREVSGADASSSVQDKRRRQVVSDDEEEQDED